MTAALLPPVLMEIRARADQVFSELGKVKAATDKMASDTEQATSKMSGAMSKASGAGKALTLGLVGAGAAVGVASVKMATDYQESITQLVTGAGESEDNIKKVSDGLLNMAGQVGVSAQDLSKGMYLVESAGYHGAEGLTVMKAAAEGAKIGAADMTTVANGLTTALTDYHIPASQAADVTSKLVATVASGKTSMGDLAGALSNVAPVAAAAGININQLLGGLATITGQGISADQASQDLASTIRSLQNPTTEQTKAMAQMGLSSLDVAQNLGKNGLTGTLDTLTAAITSHMGPAGTVLESAFNQSKLAAQSAQQMLKQLPPSLQDLGEKFLNNTITQKQWAAALKGQDAMTASLGKQFATTAKEANGFSDTIKAGGGDAKTYSAMLASMTGGATGLSTSLALTGGNLATFKSNVDTVSKASAEAGGHVKGWAQTQKDFKTQIDQAKAGVESMGIRIGMGLIPMIQSAIRVGVSWSGWLAQHKPVLIGLASVIGGVVVIAIGAYIASMVKAQVETVAKLALMVAGWLGYEAESVAAAEGAAAGAEASVLSQFATMVRAAASGFAGMIAASAGWVAEQASSAAESLALWGMYAAEWVSTQATSMAEWVATQAAGLAEAIAGGVAWAAEHAVLAASYIAENIAMAASATAAFIAENAATLGIGVAIAALVAVVIWMATHWSEVWGVVKQVAKDVWNFLKPIFDFIVKWGLMPIRIEIAVLEAIWRACWNAIKAAVETVWNWLKPVYDWVVNKLILGIKVEIAAMEAVWSAVWGAVQSSASAVWDWLKGAWDWLYGTFMAGIKAEIAVVESVWSSVWNAIQSATSNVVDFFKGVWNWISSNLFDGMKSGVQALEDVWSSVWNSIKAAVNDAWSVIQSVINAVESAISKVSSVVSSAGGAVKSVAHLLGFDDGGWVPGPDGAPQPAIVHSGEYVLSRDMLAGRAPVDPKAMAAIAGNTQTANPNAAAPAGMGGGTPVTAAAATTSARPMVGHTVQVFAQTNASPTRIAKSVGWELDRLG